MSMRSLESAILAELRQVTGKRSIRLKDIAEWSSGNIDAKDDETLIKLPDLRVTCAIKTALLGKQKAVKA